MLLKFITSGYKLFDSSVELNMVVSKGKNAFEIDQQHILKSAILYGANNSGKSSFLDALFTMKEIFDKGKIDDFPLYGTKNVFVDKPISFEVEFLLDHTYVYGIEITNHEYLKEYLHIDGKEVFSRDENSVPLDKKYFSEEVYQSTYNFLNNNELFISKAMSFTKKMTNQHISNIHTFFDKIRFFNNNEYLQFFDLITDCLENTDKRDLYNSFLDKADLSLMKRELSEEFGIPDFNEEAFLEEMKNMKDLKKEDIDLLRKAFKVKSVYQYKDKTVKVASSLFDSVGTNKFSTLLLLILDAIENGNILVIDEIDNSLHFRIARELIKLMNSEINQNAQFIMSAHDIKLLTPLIFRKEQINFIERTKTNIEMFSLGDFEDVRNDSSFENLYIKDKIGALPHPDLDEIIAKWLEYRREGKREN